MKAYFTTFNDNDNWTSGNCEGYYFHAKLFDTGSDFGIEGGRVSKLSVYDNNGDLVVNYDRGWDKKVSGNDIPYYAEIMQLLENAPKTRFAN